MNQASIDILRVLERTHHLPQIELLSSLYEHIEVETDRFKDEFSIHCAPGCGTCCEHFNPDITTLEASLVAAHLLVDSEKRPLIERLYREGVDEDRVRSTTRIPVPLHRLCGASLDLSPLRRLLLV